MLQHSFFFFLDPFYGGHVHFYDREHVLFSAPATATKCFLLRLLRCRCSSRAAPYSSRSLSRARKTRFLWWWHEGRPLRTDSRIKTATFFPSYFLFRLFIFYPTHCKLCCQELAAISTYYLSLPLLVSLVYLPSRDVFTVQILLNHKYLCTITALLDGEDTTNMCVEIRCRSSLRIVCLSLIRYTSLLPRSPSSLYFLYFLQCRVITII